MKISVSDRAHDYVVSEIGLEPGQGLNFTSKVYGATEIHDGFSVAIHVKDPHNEDILAQEEKDGIIYFTSQEDDWFFAGHDFAVDFDPDKENFVYRFPNA